MGMAISIIGFFGFVGCIIWLIVSAIRKKSKRNSLFGIAVALVMFVGGGIASANQPRSVSGSPASAVSSSASSEPTPSVASSSVPVSSSSAPPKPASSEKSVADTRKSAKSIAYKELARYPDKYKGQIIKFSGKVVQSIEDNGTFTLRVAQDEDSDKMFLVTYLPTNDARILEKDSITVYGVYNGVQSYTSTLGGQITIPYVSSADIAIK